MLLENSDPMFCCESYCLDSKIIPYVEKWTHINILFFALEPTNEFLTIRIRGASNTDF